jgi:tetratricopeptide (TPR) repeat protein
LVDAVVKQGGGMGKVLSHTASDKDVQELVGEVVERIHRAQLANITVNWGGLKVYETYPARLPELWAGRPVVVFGRYSGSGPSRVRVTGEAEGQAVSFEMPVDLPEKEPGNDVLAVTWARQKIESLMMSVAYSDSSPEVVEEVTKLALEYRLMSKYTSFVAVDEESLVEKPKAPPVRVTVPVCVPQGVSPAVFGLGGSGYEGEVVNGRLVVRAKPDLTRQAQKLLEAMAERPADPKSAAEHYAVGKRLYEARLYAEAHQELDLAVRLDSANQEAKELLQLSEAVLAVRKSKIKDAVQQLEQKEVIERQEALAEVPRQIDAGNYERALEIIKWMPAGADTDALKARVEAAKKAAEATLAGLGRDRASVDPKTAKTGSVVISAPDTLKAETVQKIYDVRDLTQGVPSFHGPRLTGTERAMAELDYNRWGVEGEKLFTEARYVQTRPGLLDDIGVNWGNAYYDSTDWSDALRPISGQRGYWNGDAWVSRADDDGDIVRQVNGVMNRDHLLRQAQSELNSVGSFKDPWGLPYKVVTWANPADLERLGKLYSLGPVPGAPADFGQISGKIDRGEGTLGKLVNINEVNNNYNVEEWWRGQLKRDYFGPKSLANQDLFEASLLSSKALVDEIKRTVRPNSWGTSGCSIEEENGQIIIHGPPDLVAEVGRYLDQRRKAAGRGAESEKMLGEPEPEWKVELRKKLEKKISFEFVQTPLGEAINHLEKESGVKMVIDPTAAEAARKPITLRLNQATVSLALQWVLKLAGLGYDLRENAAFISTPEALAPEVKMVIYDVQDLPVGAATVAEMIKALVKPETGLAKSASVEERAGKLVVVARPEVHRDIRKLLDDLRKAKVQVLIRQTQQLNAALASPDPAVRGRLVLDATRAALRAEALRDEEAADTRAKSLLLSGRELAARGAFAEARPALQLALLYDTAQARLGATRGEVAGKAFKELKELEKRFGDARLVIEPRLARKLALSLCDQPLSAALREVASAAGLKLSITRGAIEDAADLVGRKDLRVEFMDLTGMTAAGALDALLAPLRLEWSVERGRVTVSDARRGEHAAPWTYDVSVLAVPGIGELVEGKGDVDLVKAAGVEAAAFLDALRRAAGIDQPEHCFWLEPGQVVVFGNARTHQRIEGFIAGLSKSGRGDLATKAARRTAERREALAKVEKAREAEEARRSMVIIEQGGWRLLTEAAAGRKDAAALAYLTSAWHSPAAKELAAGKSPLVAMRSAWMASEAALALKSDKEMDELACAALSATSRSADAVLAALKGEDCPDESRLAALYAVLALRNGTALNAVSARRFETYRGIILPALTALGKDGKPNPLGIMASKLLEKPVGDGAGVAGALADQGLTGDDLNLLGALAARRLGEFAWNEFRAGAPERFSKGAASGRVVLIADRLSKPLLPSAKP